uniref:Uncharacterized protein n=1 Tax=Romanomermis culicivorax TaxID=13658 RepID=A0A915IZL3_ROMCU
MEIINDAQPMNNIAIVPICGQRLSSHIVLNTNCNYDANDFSNMKTTTAEDCAIVCANDSLYNIIFVPHYVTKWVCFSNKIVIFLGMLLVIEHQLAYKNVSKNVLKDPKVDNIMCSL